MKNLDGLVKLKLIHPPSPAVMLIPINPSSSAISKTSFCEAEVSDDSKFSLAQLIINSNDINKKILLIVKFIKLTKKNMKLLNEFKEFAVKGNMMEMAIGIIIGASFNSVIDVLVKQILLPPLSLLSNGLNIDSKKIILREADVSSTGDIINEEVAINYGFFIETFIDFMIVAFTIFIVIKFLNKLKIQAEDPSNNKVSTPRNIKLLTEINDSLKDLNKNLTKKN